MTHFKKGNVGITAGTGHLSNSNVVIHMKAGIERNMFRYVYASTEINFTSGLHMNGMYALDQQRTSGVPVLDMSLGFDMRNRLDVIWGKHDPNGVQIKSSLEVEHSAGFKNWGNASGAMSNMEVKDVPTILKNMNFHLNQVNADVTAEKKLGTNTTALVNTHYQGSNIGQSVSALAGLSIRAPAGAQILVFTGYRKNDIAGYKTQHSLLASPSGTQFGVKYTNKGIEMGLSVTKLPNGPATELKFKVPVGKK